MDRSHHQDLAVMTPQPDEIDPAVVDMDESESEMGEMTGPARTCIVTRKVLDKSQMIRFVAGPTGDIVPDLKGDLPGRGFWVTADRKTLDEAVRKHIFTKVTKGKAKADAGLPDRRRAGQAGATGRSWGRDMGTAPLGSAGAGPWPAACGPCGGQAGRHGRSTECHTAAPCWLRAGCGFHGRYRCARDTLMRFDDAPCGAT
ncbi:MAG: DUF448 domain-containing protein [Rhodospirillaceae bacterium]|nr:DUF448 domain-containing protein [Rhodospirillaceae bacterium]